MANGTSLESWALHLRLEHQRVCEALRAVEAAVNCWTESPQTSDAVVRHRLGRLRVLLERHFREEEQGGCLDEAAARVPRIGRAVEALYGEHAGLLALLDKVIGATKTDDEYDPPCDEVRAALFDFAQALRAHERAESEILRWGFGGDAGCLDPDADSLPEQSTRPPGDDAK